MTQNKAISQFSQAPNTQFLQPADAWAPIIIYLVLTSLLLAMGSFGAKALNFLLPLGAFIVGWRLYFRYPALYTGFVWWLFFLTPLVRRIADFRANSYTEPSPMLIAPYAAVIICAHTLYANLPKIREKGAAPFVLALAGVTYGYLVGLINTTSPQSVTVAFLEWVAPILFAFHLYIHWQRYPLYAQNIKRVFLWGVLVMGIYGVYQYLVAPEWDTFWLINSPLKTSAGAPFPFQIRVWSTMNAPGVFGAYMSVALLILFSCRNVLVAPAAGVGTLSFLLSMVRTGWLAWLFGLFFVSTTITPKQRLKLVITLVVFVALMIPLATMEPFTSTITSRLSSLTTISDDGSLKERQFLYNALIDEALTTYVGKGLGSGGFDSAILAMLFDLGWIGAIPYIGSLLLIIISVFKSSKNPQDIFASVIRAVIVSGVFFLFAGATMKGAAGMLLWGFLGLGLAGSKYFYYEKQVAAWHRAEIVRSGEA